MKKIVRFIPSFYLAVVFLPISAYSATETSQGLKKEIELNAKSGSAASGKLTISDLQGGGVHIKGKIIGLSPNASHGFHFHEKGDCSDPDAQKAGGHFNPDEKHVHGQSIVKHSYDKQHAGDLGNIISNKSGVAEVDLKIISPKLTLMKGEKYSLNERSLVIHADKDDEKSPPAGNAGKRILCGVIN